ncbi:DUF222 domain-containing protein, partial [Nocardioides sp.]|uniref:DUF222 domain-containing protein n=1 Tax=Nocardioides sp. TaxID=35761 RepID=UPI00271B22FA
MTQHTATPGSDHPIEAFLCTVADELKGLADVAVWSMDEATTDRVVVLAAKVAAGVAEVEARVIGQAGVLDRPGAAGCRILKSWLRLTTNVTGRTASAKVKLAAALSAWEPTRSATARGDLHAEQAHAIADKLALLDEHVTAHDKQRAEAFLLAEAADHDADALAHLGHEIYQRLDPEGADAREAAALQRQEARARKKTRFSMGDDG